MKLKPIGAAVGLVLGMATANANTFGPLHLSQLQQLLKTTISTSSWLDADQDGKLDVGDRLSGHWLITTS